MNSPVQDKPTQGNIKKWRQWHEREIPVDINTVITDSGLKISVTSKQLTADFELEYPQNLWTEFPKNNKELLSDNVAYLFTAHLPFLLKGNIRMQYNTGYPHIFSWASHCFLRHLPAYWYLQNARRGTHVEPMLKTILNSQAVFSRTKDVPPSFPSTKDESILIAFTFGKDSFLSYHLSKEIGLTPVLVFFRDPMEDVYEGLHKQKLFEQYTKISHDINYFIENPLGDLRQKGEGWFGWEMAITSWVVLSMPIAHRHKTGYILLSNEQSNNTFFYDKNGYKVFPDYEQSAQATQELSILTQALSEGEVYTTTFLQGLEEIGIVAILKERYYQTSIPYLMSCWAEVEASKTKRWCASCSKCARIYLYLVANNIDPIKEAGFSDNMFALEKTPLFNVFGKNASGTGWDAFGLNTEEQSVGFYLAYLHGNRDPLVRKFIKTKHFTFVKTNFNELIEKYFGLQDEKITPLHWKKKIDAILNETLATVREKIYAL